MMKQALLDDVPEEAVEPTQVRMPIDQMLGEESQGLCDRLLLRGVRAVNAACPALLPSLFGDAGLGSIPWGDVRQERRQPSITHDPGLVFTPGEPACNVYTTGGQFTPHEDGLALTVLVVLSDKAAFSGGGTGFWSEADRGGTARRASGTEYNHISPRSATPTFVLAPPAGTALVWGGTVTHAAETVLDGERTVFVASFSNAPAKRAG